MCTCTPCTPLGYVHVHRYAHKYGLVPEDEYSYLVNDCGYAAPPHIAAGAWRVDKAGVRQPA